MQEVKIGKFKTKNRFLSFISASKYAGSKVRFNRETAFIDGKKLSGMLEGLKFKMTICDENTIDFEEVDTNTVDEATLKRLIDDIDSCDVTGYAEKFVLNSLEFKDEDNNTCYLEVEYVKPINKLKMLMDSAIAKKGLSGKGVSALDNLLKKVEPTDAMEPLEMFFGKNAVEEKEKSKTISDIEESFKKMNTEKVNELKERADKLEQERAKYISDIKVTESRISQIQKELDILNVRIEDLGHSEEPNGYIFFVSEKKESLELDEETSKMIDKISSLANLNSKAVKSLVSDNRFDLKFAKKENINELVNGKEIVDLLKIDGKYVANDDFYTYIGTLKWGELVSKLEKLGFEQDPEFNKLCGSNSYNTKNELDGKN